MSTQKQELGTSKRFYSKFPRGTPVFFIWESPRRSPSRGQKYHGNILAWYDMPPKRSDRFDKVSINNSRHISALNKFVSLFFHLPRMKSLLFFLNISQQSFPPLKNVSHKPLCLWPQVPHKRLHLSFRTQVPKEPLKLSSVPRQRWMFGCFRQTPFSTSLSGFAVGSKPCSFIRTAISHK